MRYRIARPCLRMVAAMMTVHASSALPAVGQSTTGSAGATGLMQGSAAGQQGVLTGSVRPVPQPIRSCN
jgi:hypothetical protein